jgi:deoxyribodipyrimidine photo-lyase
MEFVPSRAAALERLRAFLPDAARYAEVRNDAVPGTTSGLSAHLSRRLILEEEVVAAALGTHGLKASLKFVQEVCWRTYWKGWLESRPEAWNRWTAVCARLLDSGNPGMIKDFEAACAGRTDIACFNAWAQELVRTGWLHNHVRMWFASIWIFTLRLPWELGALFFWRHLLDGDAASNTLSWRWVAGLHTAGKTYLARADNIARHTHGLHRPPPGRLASEAFVPIEAPLPKVQPEVWARSGCGGPTGLLLTREDLSPEIGALSGLRAEAVLVLGTPATGAITRDAKVEAWDSRALRDVAARAQAHFGVPVDVVEGGVATEVVPAWKASRGLGTVVGYQPPVGLVRDALQGLSGEVGFSWYTREWDRDLWPHASRGFFPFWQAAEGVIGR